MSAAFTTQDEELIGGYKVVRLLLRGQSCDIMEVVQVSTGKRYALKQLREAGAADSETRRAFAFEARLGTQLSHPNLIRVVEFVDSRRELPYFVMEYFPSVHLRQAIKDRAKHNFDSSRMRRVVTQAAGALGYMHDKGWIHRDIKPENILVNKVGETRVIDYALARRPPGLLGKLFGGRPPCQGTDSYMSPEQILRRHPTPAADMYSFGVTCYEMATGRQPFRANSRNELLQKHLRTPPPSPIVYNKEVTPEFADLLLAMIQKDPAKRPGSMREFLTRFGRTRMFTGDPDPLSAV